MKMSDRPKDLRPREKLAAKGAAALSDYELIMAIIGSGDLEVSQADRDVTERPGEAGELLDIQLVDHLIITSSSHTSII